MAEQTHDIWNDDDGEAEAKKARRPRRFLRFFLILAVVLAVVLVAAYRDGTGFDVLRRFFSYQGQAQEDPMVYRYDASSDNHFAVLGDRLVVLSNTGLSVLDRDGEETAVFRAPAQAAQEAEAFAQPFRQQRQEQ